MQLEPLLKLHWMSDVCVCNVAQHCKRHLVDWAVNR